MKFLKLFLLLTLTSFSLRAQNTLQSKTQASSPAADDWLYLQGATNNVRKLSPLYYQIADADLTYLAGFTPTANVKSILNAADYAAIRSLLSLVPGTNFLALPTGTPTGSKFLRDDNTWQLISGGGDALVANDLSQFAPGGSISIVGVTQSGATTLTPAAVTSHAILVAKLNNTEALTGNVTATFSGSLVNGRLFGITYATDGTARTVTQPAGVKFMGATVSDITIPASTTYYVQYYTDGTTVFMQNPPPVTRGAGAGYALIDGTFIIPTGKTATFNSTNSWIGTDAANYTFPTTSATIARTDASQTFSGTQTFGTFVATTLNGNTFTAGTGVLTLAAGKTLTANQTTTLDRQSSTGLPVEFYVACSDLTTNLTTGTSVAYFRAPYAFTVTEVRGSLGTTQSAGSIFTVDVNESGTTILSTKLTIDNSETTSTTAATPPVISDTAIADDAIISIDIDQVGTAGARGLIVLIKGYR